LVFQFTIALSSTGQAAAERADPEPSRFSFMQRKHGIISQIFDTSTPVNLPFSSRRI